MLRTRILTATVLACLLLAGLYWLPRAWAVPAFGAVFAIGAWEWAGFGGLRSVAARLGYAACVIVAMLGAWRWTDGPDHLVLLLAAACAWWVLAALWLSLCPQRHHPGLALACGLPVLVPPFIALARVHLNAQGVVHGPQGVLWLVLLVISADIGGYFAGRRFGRIKLAPRVSPGKTLEGAIGGLMLVAAVAWIGALHFGLPVPATVACGILIGVFSIVGDLTESMFKRGAGLKDSGSLLPGHGGLLDRIDSVTAAAPLYALGLFGSGVLS